MRSEKMRWKSIMTDMESFKKLTDELEAELLQKKSKTLRTLN